MELFNKILSFIDTKSEDDYWDFKEQWHTNKADLLHDIICLANNRVDEEAYLIIGIRDTTYEIVGVENDVNRKTQQNLIDFLNTKPFIGGIRPSIELKSFNIDTHEVDIIVIKNSTDTPYFLIDDYRDKSECVHKYAIYTRIKDTNTPKDKTADINQIEFLWKKRFLLNRSPIERLFHSLNDFDNWKKQHSDVIHISSFYNKFNPEYTISLVSDDDYYGKAEFYAYVFTNKSVHYGQIIVKYFNTEVYSTQYVTLDGGRYTVPTPSWEFVSETTFSNTITYKYYLIDGYDYKLFNFINRENNLEENYYKTQYFDTLLIFKTEEEKDDFNRYLKSDFKNIYDKINIEKNNIKIFEVDNKNEEKVIQERLATAKILKEIQLKISEEVNRGRTI